MRHVGVSQMVRLGPFCYCQGNADTDRVPCGFQGARGSGLGATEEVEA
jgi:hypothetical protein